MSEAPLDGAPSAEWRVETGDETDWLSVYGRVAEMIVLGRMRGAKTVPMDVLDAALRCRRRSGTDAPLLLGRRRGRTRIRIPASSRSSLGQFRRFVSGNS